MPVPSGATQQGRPKAEPVPHCGEMLDRVYFS